MLQAEIDNSDDESVVIVTDSSWRVKVADDWDFNSAGSAEGFQEVYDSRRKPVGWNVVGFDDSNWATAEVIGEVGSAPWTSLVPRGIPALRERSVYPERVVGAGWVDGSEDSRAVMGARSVLEPYNETAEIMPGRDSFVALDFGRELVGFPRLAIRDAGYAVVEISYEEPGVSSEAPPDRLILHGGRQDWDGFRRRSFRYMRLTFRDAEAQIRLECVSMRQIGYPAEQVSSFECSDEVLNRVWQAGVDRLALCMQDLYEQSPLLDVPQGMAGARVQALMNYYCFGDLLLAARTLRESVRRPGSHRDSLIWVTMLHDYCIYARDMELAEELFADLCGILDECSPEPDPFYYQALRDGSKIANNLGRLDESVRWHERAREVAPTNEQIEDQAPLPTCTRCRPWRNSAWSTRSWRRAGPHLAFRRTSCRRRCSESSRWVCLPTKWSFSRCRENSCGRRDISQCGRGT